MAGTAKKVIVRGTQCGFLLGLSAPFYFLGVCINYISLPIRFAPPGLLLHPEDKNNQLTLADKRSEKRVSVGVWLPWFFSLLKCESFLSLKCSVILFLFFQNTELAMLTHICLRVGAPGHVRPNVPAHRATHLLESPVPPAPSRSLRDQSRLRIFQDGASQPPWAACPVSHHPLKGSVLGFRWAFLYLVHAVQSGALFIMGPLYIMGSPTSLGARPVGQNCIIILILKLSLIPNPQSDPNPTTSPISTVTGYPQLHQSWDNPALDGLFYRFTVVLTNSSLCFQHHVMQMVFQLWLHLSGNPGKPSRFTERLWT